MSLEVLAPSQNDPKLPLVSVIVPTRNSAGTLATCLESIRKQSYPKIEPIVVDNFSTDSTCGIATSFAARFYRTGPERSAQRNEGARQSKGVYLTFIDSDMELQPRVIEDCVRKADEGYTAIIIPEISKGEGFWSRCRSLEKLCYIGDDDIEAARFFRRDVFFQHGGYDERIAGGGEDWDLPQRIRNRGGKVARIEARILHNEGRLELGTCLAKKYYYGKTIGIYRKKHPELARRQLWPVRPALIRNWRLFLLDPLHGCGLVILKGAEFTAGGFGYLTSRTVDRTHASESWDT